MIFNTFDRIEVIDPPPNDNEDKVIKDNKPIKITFDLLNEDIICEFICPNTSSLACFIINGCSGEIKKLIYYIIGSIIIMFFISLLFYN